MTIHKFFFGMVVALTAIFCLSVTTAQARGGDKDKKDGEHGKGHTPVTLCHWAGNEQHGKYVLITVDDDGSSGNKNLEGHAGHERDIIPAPAEGCPKEEVPTETPCPTETPRPADTPTRTSTPNSPTPTATVQVNNPSRSNPSSTPTATATTIRTTSTVVVPTTTPDDRIKPPQTGNAGLAANR